MNEKSYTAQTDNRNETKENETSGKAKNMVHGSSEDDMKSREATDINCGKTVRDGNLHLLTREHKIVSYQQNTTNFHCLTVLITRQILFTHQL
jgi:hypothetical protein